MFVFCFANCDCRLHSKSRVKKRHHSESGAIVSVSEIKKSPVSDQKPISTESGIDRNNPSHATKKSKLSGLALGSILPSNASSRIIIIMTTKSVADPGIGLRG